MAVLLSAMTIAIGLYDDSFSALAILCGVSVSVNRASSLTRQKPQVPDVIHSIRGNSSLVVLENFVTIKEFKTVFVANL